MAKKPVGATSLDDYFGPIEEPHITAGLIGHSSYHYKAPAGEKATGP